MVELWTSGALGVDLVAELVGGEMALRESKSAPQQEHASW